MGKKISIILTVLLLLTTSLPVLAGGPDSALIYNGYTRDGIYYEVYGDPISQSSVLSRSTINVERSIFVDGKIIPPNEIEWSEKINGIIYSGVLKLSFYTYFKDTTTAYYNGTLSPK